jgi:hypothetical protein
MLAVAGASVAPAGAAARSRRGPSGKCARHRVGGQRVCLRVGRHCDPDLQHDYLKAKLYCRNHRLRRAGLAAQREGEPLFIDRHGRIDPRNALEAFDLKVARLPGVKPRRGAVGHLEDATGIVAAV